MFTLVLNDNGLMTLTIYTITGKKIRTIKQDGQRGYNQIIWDGTDDDGDYLANNTYLYKVRVKNGSKTAEKTGQFIIYH
jgi:flagellar hook assembly protein FlgD